MLGFWKKKDKNTTEDKADNPAQQPQVEAPLVAESAVETVTTPEEESASWLQRMSSGLSQSSQKLTQGIVDAVTKRPLDQDALDELEEALIMADLGPSLAARLVEEFSKTRFGKQVDAQEVKQALAAQIASILAPVAKPLVIDDSKKPFVILMVGVNGSGKTTTIGKLAQQYAQQGKKVVLAAGDTFRAAAVEQLQMWGDRTGATVISKGLNTDSAAVAFEALQKAQELHADILLIDTAGRLHTKSNLMEELAKIHRVIQKQIPDAPHAVLLTLDSTIGQNAVAQVQEFNQVTRLDGLVVTKLDGSARGGIVVALAEKFAIPVVAVGVGEAAADLHSFEAQNFANALLAG